MDPTQSNNPAGEPPVNNDTASEDAAWDQAGLDFLADRGEELPDKRSEEQEAIQNEPTKQKEGDENGKTPEGDPAAKKSDEEQGNGDGTEKGTGTEENGGKPKTEDTETPPAPTPEQADRDYRRRQLELDADRKEIATEVRKEMFSDVPDKLLDADGDPIETVADVMKLKNPNTGKPFTAEEAASWLMQAQRHVEKQNEQVERQVEEIVNVNLSIKEQADSVREKYGELLQYMPKLRARVWAQYEKTLIKDDKTDTITKAPVSMEEFYDTALAPYVREAERIKAEAEAEDKKKADEEAAKKKQAAEEAKTRSRSDREDIFSTKTKIEEMNDPEEKAWAKAAKEYYED